MRVRDYSDADDDDEDDDEEDEEDDDIDGDEDDVDMNDEDIDDIQGDVNDDDDDEDDDHDDEDLAQFREKHRKNVDMSHRKSSASSSNFPPSTRQRSFSSFRNKKRRGSSPSSNSLFSRPSKSMSRTRNEWEGGRSLNRFEKTQRGNRGKNWLQKPIFSTDTPYSPDPFSLHVFPPGRGTNPSLRQQQIRNRETQSMARSKVPPRLKVLKRMRNANGGGDFPFMISVEDMFSQKVASSNSSSTSSSHSGGLSRIPSHSSASSSSSSHSSSLSITSPSTLQNAPSSSPPPAQTAPSSSSSASPSSDSSFSPLDTFIGGKKDLTTANWTPPEDDDDVREGEARMVERREARGTRDGNKGEKSKLRVRHGGRSAEELSHLENRSESAHHASSSGHSSTGGVSISVSGSVRASSASFSSTSSSSSRVNSFSEDKSFTAMSKNTLQ